MSNDPFCFQIWSGTLFLLTNQASYCWALLNSWEGHPRTPQTRHSRTSASLLGNFAGECLWCCSQKHRNSLSWNSPCGRSHECHPQWLSCLLSRVKRNRTPPSGSRLLFRCRDWQKAARLFRSRGPRCLIIPPLWHQSFSARLLLCVCDAGFQGTVNCVLTWRLRCCLSCAECQTKLRGNIVLV